MKDYLSSCDKRVLWLGLFSLSLMLQIHTGENGFCYLCLFLGIYIFLCIFMPSLIPPQFPTFVGICIRCTKPTFFLLILIFFVYLKNYRRHALSFEILWSSPLPVFWLLDKEITYELADQKSPPIIHFFSNILCSCTNSKV